MKKYYDSGDVSEMIAEFKGLIKDLWCSVNELMKRTPVNIGTGIGWFKRYYKNTWEFKSIKAGSNITITDSGDDITISATGGGTVTCQDIDDCLGISPSGDPTLVLNEQGDFISVSATFDCSDLNSCDTDNLPEGTTNLYFTDSRAINALTGEPISIFINDSGYITSNYISSISDTTTIDLGVLAGNLTANFIGTTSNVTEGSNLYFTNGRAVTALTGQNISLFVNDAGYITTNYISSITDTATIDLTVTGSALSAAFVGNTSNVPESGNLYYTDTRARAAISLTTTGTSGAATYNSGTGVLNIPVYTSLVSSVFGRTGAVIAVAGDYNAGLVTFTPYGSITATDVQTAIQQTDDIMNPSKYWYFYTDYEGDGNSAAQLMSDKLAVTLNSGSFTGIAGESGRVGIYAASTTTITTGAVLAGSSTAIVLNGGVTKLEHVIRLPILSTGAEEYTVRIGSIDNINTDGTNCLFFRYSSALNGGNWQIVARSGGLETATNLVIAPVANTWYKLTIIINSTGTSAEYFIDGVSVGTIATANVPTGAAIRCSVQIKKSAGGTARILHVDYSFGTQKFNTSR